MELNSGEYNYGKQTVKTMSEVELDLLKDNLEKDDCTLRFGNRILEFFVPKDDPCFTQDIGFTVDIEEVN